jgi:hypothetical protein
MTPHNLGAKRGIWENVMAERTMVLRAGEVARDLAAGGFQDFADIERELIAFGNKTEITLIVRRNGKTTDGRCVSEHAREVATWRIHTAC